MTLAELAAGPHATDDTEERARRQERLQRTEATFDALPLDDSCARAYGRVYAAVASAGRKARGPRVLDLLIGATAITHERPSTRSTRTISAAWTTCSKWSPWRRTRHNRILPGG